MRLQSLTKTLVISLPMLTFVFFVAFCWQRSHLEQLSRFTGWLAGGEAFGAGREAPRVSRALAEM
jgi:hypothetical protein